jgi:rhodanese-related sulfurtransferase
VKALTKRSFLCVILSWAMLFSLCACATNNAQDESKDTEIESGQVLSEGSSEAFAESDVTNAPAYPVEALASAEELQQVLGQEAQLTVIDVRSTVSYKTSCIPKTRSIPLERMQDRISEIPREGGLVLVSTDEEQASEAWSILASEGYDMNVVFVMPDDLAAWQAAGYEVATNAAEDCGC